MRSYLLEFLALGGFVFLKDGRARVRTASGLPENAKARLRTLAAESRTKTPGMVAVLYRHDVHKKVQRG